MNQRIARILELLLRRLLPGRGRHRATDVPTVLAPSPASVSALVSESTDAPLPPPPSALIEPVDIRGEDTALVRPYLLTPEQWSTERHRRRVQRTLWVLPHGVDIDPPLVRPVKVPSRTATPTQAAPRTAAHTQAVPTQAVPEPVAQVP